jgi:hypothetical protein
LTNYVATVEPGKYYFFKVQAFNNVDSSQLSLESAGLLAASIPDAPYDLIKVA